MECEGVSKAVTKSKEDRIRRMKVQHQAEGYLELGLPQQALDALDRLGTAGTADARSLYLQGEALRSLERYADAIVPLRKVAELEPENVQVLLALGWCHKAHRADRPGDWRPGRGPGRRRRRSPDPLQPGLLSQRGGRQAHRLGQSRAGPGSGSQLSPLDRSRAGLRFAPRRCQVPGRLRRRGRRGRSLLPEGT